MAQEYTVEQLNHGRKVYDFMRWDYWAFGISGLLLIAAIVIMGVRGFNWGLDFTGGTVIEITLEKPAEIDVMRDALQKAGFEEPMLQNFGSSHDIMVRMPPAEGETGGQVLGSQVLKVINESTNQNAAVKRIEFVGPSVGADLAQTGAMALMAALLSILVYVGFRFEWRLAAGVVIALAHDVIITLGNLFLVPVLAVGMMFVPFWFIRLTANHYKKNIAAELETALSIITTAYLRNEDIQTAVEENIDYLNPPVRSVFVEFLTRIKLVDPDVDAALQDMGTKIDNAVFREWVAALLTCRHDRGLKTILTPIVAKLSDMRIVNGELENLVFEPRKEFITMQVLVIGNIPLLYWLNQDWYDVLMHTPLGQALLAAIAAVMFISTAAVIKLTQPIEYRR